MMPVTSTLLLKGHPMLSGSPVASAAPAQPDITSELAPLAPALDLVFTAPSSEGLASAPLLDQTASGTDPADTVETSADENSDPAAMLALLLGSLVPPAATGEEPPVTALNTMALADSTAGAAPALNVSSPRENAAVTLAAATPAPASSEAAVGQNGAATQIVKLKNPADALLASKQVMKEMLTQREEAISALQPLPATQPTVNPALAMRVATPETSAPVINLPAAPEQQAQALQQALGERLQMQIDRRTQKATIRLDPPSLGKMEIALHFEAGKLQVQIQASQPDVYRALQQVSHELRASLSEQNNVQVNVQVSTQSGDSRQQQRHRDEAQAGIAQNFEESADGERRTDRSILTMV